MTTAPPPHRPLSLVPIRREAALVAPPLREIDGLAQDAPVQPLHSKVFRNPGIRFMLFLALAIVLIIVGVVVAMGAASRVGTMEAAAVQLVAITAAYLILVLALERRLPPLELDPRRVLGLPAGLLLGAGLFLVCFGVIWLLGGFRITGIDPSFDWWPMVFIAGIVAGITEELMFRGVLYRLGEELLGTWGAMVLSAAFFGIVHLNNRDGTLWGAIAIALEAGLLFAALYAVTRSLWLLIGVHAAWNITQGPILGLIVSGSGFSGGFVETSRTGPDWLTGGSFGPEASYVTVAILLALAVALMVLIVRRGLVVKPRWTRRALMRQRGAAPDGVPSPLPGRVPPGTLGA